MPEHDQPGIIAFDAGTVMTTPTEWVFHQFIKMHPGALSFWKNWTKTPNKCGHSRCDMLSFQWQLNHLFDANPEKCANFFNVCLKFDGDTPSDQDMAHELEKFLGRSIRQAKGAPPIQTTTGSPIIDQLKAAFPGATIIGLDLGPIDDG